VSAMDRAINHGTYGGAQQHRLAGERSCGPCKAAYASYIRCWRWRRTGRPRYSWRDRDQGLDWGEKTLHEVRLAAAAAADMGAPLDRLIDAVREGYAASWTVQHSQDDVPPAEVPL
jgi:hypothetical protein